MWGKFNLFSSLLKGTCAYSQLFTYLCSLHYLQSYMNCHQPKLANGLTSNKEANLVIFETAL